MTVIMLMENVYHLWKAQITSQITKNSNQEWMNDNNILFTQPLKNLSFQSHLLFVNLSWEYKIENVQFSKKIHFKLKLN